MALDEHDEMMPAPAPSPPAGAGAGAGAAACEDAAAPADDGGGRAGGGEYVSVRTRAGVRERLVTPYNFDFSAGCKRRWEGRTLLEVFMEEFPIRTEAYYRKAIAARRLRVERAGAKGEVPAGPPPADGGLLRGGDRIVHRIHRHEPPVLDTGPVAVLGVGEDYVAVCKPASMPVHVCGQYRLNSLLATLERERADLGPLFSCNRLDVPVSGVLVLARSSDAARDFSARLEGRRVRKLYVARVRGDFSDAARGAGGVYECEAPLGYDPRTRRAFVADAAAPSDDRKKRKARRAGAPAPAPDAEGGRTGSYARTRFKMLCRSEDGLSSVVLCEPVTGRTHQIRIHLKHAGHPIVDDATYNDDARSPGGGDGSAGADRCVEIVGAAPRPWAVEPTCPHCPFLRSPDFDTKPPQSLCLHAIYYAAEELFEYASASLPAWAERHRWPDDVDMFGISGV